MDLKKRFPSPVLGSGPGEYQSSEELEAVKKAVHWTREQYSNLQPGDRFPTPKLGTGPGEFASQAELDAAKQAIMWSRMCGQVGEASDLRLRILLPQVRQELSQQSSF